MTDNQTTWLAANSASGSNGDGALERVVDRLGVAGLAPARIIDVSSQDLPTRSQLEAGNVDLLVMFTGDGTLGAALPALEGWGGKVLVLPGGTTNLLAKMLHEPCETEAIIAAVGSASARVTRHPCIRFAARTALCEVLAGPGAKWSDVREGLRDGDISTVASSAVEAAKESTAGTMVRITSPDTGHDEGYAGVRLVPQETGLEVSGYRTEGFGDVLKQGVALLKRNFREGPHDKLGAHREVECTSLDGRTIELMIDGERGDSPSPMRFSLATLELDLLATGNG